LPVLQQAYSSLTNMRGWQIPLQQTIELLNQKLPNHLNKPKSYQLKFNKTIALNKVCFMYSNEEIQVLNNVTLNILKGERIGFIGSTGGGKSTLLDIVMGLLEPTKGSLEIDGIKITSENSYMWQANISHVPQAIFLADSSVTENIAFGIPKELIDHQKVRRAAESAQISKTIESLPQKYETYVGERGVRLSGGQRQRIGIARALYKQAQVIIFDEATSALDQETEASVMQAIDQLSSDLTILIVAHRLTTLKGCTKIVELSMGRISRVGTYDEIVGLSKAN
jgi:ABC-type multidrug transport system fused ATPase/permease subunit